MVFSKHARRAFRFGSCVALFVVWATVGIGAPPATGHVLKGPHVLDLMTDKKTTAQTLQVDQQVIVENSTISGSPLELSETLNYLFPDRFRSEMRHENTLRIHVHSQGRSLTIVDDTISADREGRFDRYKDILLYNTRRSLHKVLSLHGVDVGITSLGRMDDHVVLIIGARFPDESVSQVWVDKERFIPLRWINVFPTEDADGESDRVEFFYRNWQNADGVWYPMQIETYLNRKLVRQVRATKVQANVAVKGELLNIQHLMTVYKKEMPLTDDGTPESGVDEVERTIEDFKKKFEP